MLVWKFFWGAHRKFLYEELVSSFISIHIECLAAALAIIICFCSEAAVDCPPTLHIVWGPCQCNVVALDHRTIFHISFASFTKGFTNLGLCPSRLPGTHPTVPGSFRHLAHPWPSLGLCKGMLVIDLSMQSGLRLRDDCKKVVWSSSFLAWWNYDFHVLPVLCLQNLQSQTRPNFVASFFEVPTILLASTLLQRQWTAKWWWGYWWGLRTWKLVGRRSRQELFWRRGSRNGNGTRSKTWNVRLGAWTVPLRWGTRPANGTTVDNGTPGPRDHGTIGQRDNGTRGQRDNGITGTGPRDTSSRNNVGGNNHWWWWWWWRWWWWG